MFKDDKNTILIWVTTLFIEKKSPKKSSPNVLYDINANFCSFNIKRIDLLSTKYYIICTKFIHTLGCHDQYCFINDIHQYVSRRFLNNLKCTVIHFKIIKNTKKISRLCLLTCTILLFLACIYIHLV